LLQRVLQIVLCLAISSLTMTFLLGSFVGSMKTDF
jgi:vacuolar-type H+-ATPase subunit I/STV1